MSVLAGNLLGASLLLALVLLIRRPVARHFGARAAYALWLAPALRLFMPPLPDLGPPAAPSAGVGYSLLVQPAAAAASAAPLPWPAIWAAGAALFLAVHLVRHALFVRRALRHGRPYAGAAIACDAVITPAVEGPAATGLVHRLVLLPADFEQRFTPEQQRLALLHEWQHHCRGDIWASAAALVGAAALWFNPLTYVALGAFRRDMESACDRSVLSAPGACDPLAYGQTILASAARPIPRSLCALTSLDELKGRLTMLDTNHGSLRQLAGLGLAFAVTLGGMTFAGPALADEPRKEVIEKRVIISDGSGKHAAHGADVRMSCPGEKISVESTVAGTDQEKNQAKIVICSKGGDRAKAAEGLERALADIEKNDDMNPAIRADITAKLKAKIAELRGR